MSNERLTRHEITWLLAQEARGAAKALRSGLGAPGTELRPEAAPVETTLDALDDTIDMLSQLNAGARGKVRRGRIDLAALLYEIAPNARISIEPGAGTEVFGEESELRRMLNLLVTQASTSAGAAPSAETVVNIRRQGDLVRIAVELGPDTTATGELERRWLSRMAVRHGGCVELEGGTQSIYLQADGASDRREVTELRKELAEAQQLGEAYARELAAVLSAGEIRTEPPPLRAGDDDDRLDVLKSASGALQRFMKGLLEALRHDGSEAAAGALAGHLPLVHDTLGELSAIAECSLDEPRQNVELRAALGEAVERAAARASRAAVECSLDLDGALYATARPQVLSLLLDSALVHAIAATPRGGKVHIASFSSELGVVVTFSDDGPVIPEAARFDVIRHRVDPTSLGRPSGLSLVVAEAAAVALGGAIDLREGVDGRQELWLTLKPRGSIPAR